MKITKNELRKIIKEEKSRLLNEMNPRANAERSLSVYANVALVDGLKNSVSQLLEQIETDAFEDLGDERDAEEAALNAVLLVLAEAFGLAGYGGVQMQLGKLVK